MSDIDVLNEIQNLDLSTVETEFPLLASGVVAAQVQECEFKRDEDKGADAKPYLWVKYAITQPWKTVAHEGLTVKQLNPGDRGMTISQRIYIGQYDKKDGSGKAWYGLDTVAKLRESAFGKAPAGTRLNPSEMLGQSVLLVLKFDPAPKNSKTGEVYGPRTEVSGFVRKA